MINPDTKNWTWVLKRQCPDCGFNAASFVPERAGQTVRDLSDRWQKVLQRENVTDRPQPHVWSPLEYGCHVRDVFRLFNKRLELMLTEIDPSFENWDQDKTAIDDNYSNQDPKVVAAGLISAASALADRFDGVRKEDGERRGFRSDGTVFTVVTFAQYLIHDPVHHLWDVGAEVPKY